MTTFCQDEPALARGPGGQRIAFEGARVSTIGTTAHLRGPTHFSRAYLLEDCGEVDRDS